VSQYSVADTEPGHFDKEVLHAIDQMITLPHLTPYRRAFVRHSSVVPDYICSPTALSAPPRLVLHRVLASANFNSARSIQNRHLRTAIARRLTRCLQRAQLIVNDFRPATSKDLLRKLCAAVVQTPWSTLFLSDWINSDVSDADEACIAYLVGRSEFTQSTNWYGTGTIFGPGISFAALRATKFALTVRQEQVPGPTVFHDAIEAGQVEIVRVLLEAWAPTLSMRKECQRIQYRWYVIRAVKAGNFEILRLLMNALQPQHFHTSSAYKDYMLSQRHLALMYAVRFAQTSIVEMLLQKGVEVDRLDERGVSAVGLARARGYVRIENLLMEKGARVLGNQEKVGDEAADEFLHRLFLQHRYMRKYKA
jgi:hypothetical protein